MKNKTWLKIDKNTFTLTFGDPKGWFKGLDKKWRQVIVTNKGVFLNGTLLAEGKLKLSSTFLKEQEKVEP